MNRNRAIRPRPAPAPRLLVALLAALAILTAGPVSPSHGAGTLMASAHEPSAEAALALPTRRACGFCPDARPVFTGRPADRQLQGALAAPTIRLVGSAHEPSEPTGRPADRQYKRLQGGASAASCAVRGYIKRMESRFRAYERAGERADAAFAQPDAALVGAGLRESETAFLAVASAIAGTAAPRCLASPHRELTTAVRRLAEAMGILSGAFEELALTGDWAAFDASNVSAQELLAGAGRLQQRFRAAVRREARRARVPIPAWLRD